MSNECGHEWEFLQTLWEQDRMTGTATWGNSREYAYFTCHICRQVEKRLVTPAYTVTSPTNSNEEKE